MIVVLLAALAVEAVTVCAFLSVIRSERRAAGREREAASARETRLVDQVCHLSGQPWTLPPRMAASAWPQDGEIADRPRSEEDDPVRTGW